MTHNTPNTSRSAAVRCGAYAEADGLPPSEPLPPALLGSYSDVVRLPPVPKSSRTGWNGLSRMKGNFHVRLFGGGGRATARVYPAPPVNPSKTQ
jgi:hypothetical protein